MSLILASHDFNFFPCVFGSALDRIDFVRIDTDRFDYEIIDFERINLCSDTLM